jgi:A/G-specific adenine glycosylase
MHDYGGQLPATVAELQALPGVGPYTARAVAALAFDLPVGAVDVNVRRVLGRIVAGDPATLGPAELQRLADEAVPASGPGEWTHAVMDLGATVCRPRVPRCTTCPARAWCRYTTRRAEAAAGATSWNTAGAAAGAPAGAAGGSSAPRRRAVREPPAPFASTTRWLRGRILDRLRAAPDGVWVELPDPIGTHDGGHVRATATRMAADGLLELDDGAADGLLRARLPLG